MVTVSYIKIGKQYLKRKRVALRQNWIKNDCTGTTAQSGVNIFHDGIKNEHEYCLRCGRKLKNPEARVLGYGKICYEKMQNNNLIRLF